MKKTKKQATEPVVVVESRPLRDDFRDNYTEYGTFVAKDRAIPDVRDGLKSSQRRLLYASWELGLHNHKPYGKSSEVIGYALGVLHPHGDQALYDTLVKLTQEYKNPAHPVSGEGNLGTMSESRYAAMRYTSVKLSPVGELLTEGLKHKGLIPMKPNYLDKGVEPTVLPAPIPYLLIAGTSGISVGFSSYVPTHNPVEVLELYETFIKKKGKLKLNEAMSILKGPDFLSGGELIDNGAIREFYETGVGSFLVRGSIKREKDHVVITQVHPSSIGSVRDYYDQLIELIANKKLVTAAKAENYTNKNGVFIEVYPKPEYTLEQLEKELFVKTRLEQSIKAEFIALHNRKPKQYSLLEYLEDYSSFHKELVIGLLKKKQEELERKLFSNRVYQRIHDNTELIIKTIRFTDKPALVLSGKKTVSDKDASHFLKKELKALSDGLFSEEEAAVVLELPIKRLARLEQALLEKEEKALEKDYQRVLKTLASDSLIDKELLKELEKAKAVFPKEKHPRRTMIVTGEKTVFSIKEKTESLVASIDRYGYLKTVSVSNKGWLEDGLGMIEFQSDDRLFAVTNNGSVVSIKASSIKLNKAKDRGTLLSSLFGLEDDEFLLTTVFTQAGFEKQELLSITKNGYWRVVKANELIGRNSRSVFLRIKEDDSLLTVTPLEKGKELLLISSTGGVKRLATKDAPVTGKTAYGNKAVSLKTDSVLDKALLLEKDEPVVVFGKTVKLEDYSLAKPNSRMN